MNKARWLFAALFSLLGLLGFFVAAEVTFQPATFRDGEVLSAAGLNELFNHNFGVAKTALETQQNSLGALQGFAAAVAAGACPAGSAMRAVAASGAVACQPVSGNTGVSSLNGQTGALALEAGANIAIDDAREGKLVIGTVGLLSAVASDGSLTGNGSSSSPLALADGVVTATKLAPLAAGTGQIANAAITTIKLLDGAVTTAKLADGAVSGAKLANFAINSPTKVLNGALRLSHFRAINSSAFGAGRATLAAGACRLSESIFPQAVKGDMAVTLPTQDLPAGVAWVPVMVSRNGFFPHLLCNYSAQNLSDLEHNFTGFVLGQ